jgi:hypothetical protein
VFAVSKAAELSLLVEGDQPYRAFPFSKVSLDPIGQLLLFLFFSGYGSQAVSSTTLSSEDSMSLKSISVDDTPGVNLTKLFTAVIYECKK